MSFHVPERFRVHQVPTPIGMLYCGPVIGNNGIFYAESPVSAGWGLFILATDGITPDETSPPEGWGWEHVSVSCRRAFDRPHGPVRAPSWAEMCWVKDLFWDPEDTVAQFHPRRSEYVNEHPACLHLWRRIGVEFELPPSVLVGRKS